jgi:hypothetical protein
MTTQSISYSTIQSLQPTTVKGYDVDGIDADGRPVRVRRNRFGGVVPVRGATLLTAYGKGVVTGYTTEGNLRVAITDFNDDYAFELADGSDIYTAEEQVAMLSRCANAGINSLIETITRLYKSEITGKLSKTWQEKVDAIERFASNEFVMDLTDKSYVPADTECIVKVIALDRETKAERKRRKALEIREARKLRRQLLERYDDEFGSDDMPEDVANEIADEFGDADEIEGEF